MSIDLECPTLNKILSLLMQHTADQVFEQLQEDGETVCFEGCPDVLSNMGHEQESDQPQQAHQPTHTRQIPGLQIHQDLERVSVLRRS